MSEVDSNLKEICPICLNDDFDYLEGSCRSTRIEKFDAYYIECDICGIFIISEQAKSELYRYQNKFSKAQRAAVSHMTKSNTIAGQVNLNSFTTSNIRQVFLETALPSFIEQKKNALNYIDVLYRHQGNRINILPKDFHSIVGTLDRSKAIEVVFQLEEENRLSCGKLHPGPRWEAQSIALL